mmetsp:Transcript_63793/g.186588  ORF Transcript_63793/g.186588 Transcript_63793/m.186588 type:complete len:420 (+) Transcript_63793:158-1417(+)
MPGPGAEAGQGRGRSAGPLRRRLLPPHRQERAPPLARGRRRLRVRHRGRVPVREGVQEPALQGHAGCLQPRQARSAALGHACAEPRCRALHAAGSAPAWRDPLLPALCQALLRAGHAALQRQGGGEVDGLEVQDGVEHAPQQQRHDQAAEEGRPDPAPGQDQAALRAGHFADGQGSAEEVGAENAGDGGEERPRKGSKGAPLRSGVPQGERRGGCKGQEREGEGLHEHLRALQAERRGKSGRGAGARGDPPRHGREVPVLRAPQLHDGQGGGEPARQEGGLRQDRREHAAGGAAGAGAEVPEPGVRARGGALHHGLRPGPHTDGGQPRGLRRALLGAGAASAGRGQGPPPRPEEPLPDPVPHRAQDDGRPHLQDGRQEDVRRHGHPGRRGAGHQRGAGREGEGEPEAEGGGGGSGPHAG